MQTNCISNKLFMTVFLISFLIYLPQNKAEAGITYEYPEEVIVSLLNSNNLNEGEIILRIASKKSYSGCVDITELTYEMEIDDGMIEIVTDGYAVKDTTGKECNSNYKVPVANIVLSLDKLKQKGIQLIKFNNGDIEDIYAVDKTKEYIKITPQGKTRFFFQAGWKGGTDQMKLYHRPDNMVVLFVKDPPHRDIKKYMDQFAKKHNLVVENSNYIYPSKRYGFSEFLYKDTKNLYLQKVERVPFLNVGKITIHNEREGQYRNRPENVTLDVYVKKP